MGEQMYYHVGETDTYDSLTRVSTKKKKKKKLAGSNIHVDSSNINICSYSHEIVPIDKHIPLLSVQQTLKVPCTNTVELTVKSTKYFWLFSPTQLFTLSKTKQKCDWSHVYSIPDVFIVLLGTCDDHVMMT